MRSLHFSHQHHTSDDGLSSCRHPVDCYSTASVAGQTVFWHHSATTRRRWKGYVAFWLTYSQFSAYYNKWIRLVAIRWWGGYLIQFYFIMPTYYAGCILHTLQIGIPIPNQNSSTRVYGINFWENQIPISGFVILLLSSSINLTIF